MTVGTRTYIPANVTVKTVDGEIIFIEKKKAKIIKEKKERTKQLYCFIDGKKLYYMRSLAATFPHMAAAKEYLINKYPSQSVTFEMV